MSKTIKRLSPPALPDFVLERPEVNRAIDAAMRKPVVFIHAPAGFGKTLALSMWLLKKKVPAAWISLTIYDDGPSVFCRYLLKALSSLDDSAAGPAMSALDDPGFDAAPIEYFFKVVSSISDDCTEGIIVLDDFHLIENESILKALPLMVKKLSPAYKIAALSRLNPPESFSELALKNRIGEISENDLRFSKKQIISLYKRYDIELSQSEAAEIEAQTGGWALGLGARLLSVKAGSIPTIFGHASGEEYINGYLKNEIWDKWDKETREFLLKTSILEDLPPELCDRLCGCNSLKIFSELMSNSGLIVRLSDGSYRYHHILRDFLRQMAEEQHAELSPLYIMAAQYMYKAGRFPAALDYYVKSKDYDKLNDFILRTIDYNFSKISTEEYYFSFKNLVMDKVPTEILEENASLITLCAYINWVTGNLEQMNFWFSKARNLLSTVDDIQTVGTLISILYLDPLIDPWKFINIKILDGVILEAVPSISLTMNLPFFHRALRDYSEYMNNWEVLFSKLAHSFKPILGAYANVMVNGITSGIYYEQDKLVKAKEYAFLTLSHLTEDSNPEMLFSFYMHMAAILFAEADEKAAREVIGKTGSLVEKKALYLKKNLEAMITKYHLYKGDKGAAKNWLSGYAVNNLTEVPLYQIFQVLTTIRAKITIGEYSSALILLASLEKLALNCRRPLDQLEALILKSIIFWREGRRADAVDCIKNAVLLARPCGYIRMFANEGPAVIPILQKLYNNVASHSEEDALLNFIRELIFAATENAKSYPGLAGGPEDKMIHLSKQQALMLSLLAAGMNNRQICEKTGLKLNTVKAHLFKLYEKLEVNSAIDAVLKARQTGLLPKSE